MFEPMRCHRRVCQNCQSAHAGFIYRKRWRVRDDHDLCLRCYRSLMTSMAVGERRAHEHRI